MKLFARCLGVFVLLAGLGVSVRSAGNTDLQDLCTGKNNSNCPYKVDVNGNVTAAGSVTAVGGTISGSLTQSGLIAWPTSGFTGVQISTTIPVNTSFEVLQTSGANITITATPSISTATVVGGSTAIPDGTWLILSSTSTQTITFQDNGTLSGSKLHLAANTRVVGADKVLTLIFNAALGFWTEVAYANNN